VNLGELQGQAIMGHQPHQTHQILNLLMELILSRDWLQIKLLIQAPWL